MKKPDSFLCQPAVIYGYQSLSIFGNVPSDSELGLILCGVDCRYNTNEFSSFFSQGCQRIVEDWQRILMVRSLVVNPHEDMRTWLKYASLCGKSGRLVSIINLYNRFLDSWLCHATSISQLLSLPKWDELSCGTDWSEKVEMLKL